MSNLEIIIKDAIASHIFTEDQIEGYLSEGSLPLRTFKSWRAAGYIVRKGEQAALKTRLWQPCNKKKADEDNDEKSGSYVLVPAYLFTSEQVVPIGG